MLKSSSVVPLVRSGIYQRAARWREGEKGLFVRFKHPARTPIWVKLVKEFSGITTQEEWNSWQNSIEQGLDAMGFVVAIHWLHLWGRLRLQRKEQLKSAIRTDGWQKEMWWRRFLKGAITTHEAVNNWEWMVCKAVKV